MTLVRNIVRDPVRDAVRNIIPNTGPWEYADLSTAESSGDPWVDGDQVTITGGAVFTYLDSLAVSGYSGLIHKYPWDGTGVLGSVTTAGVNSSQAEGTDPDTWGWTDNGTGTKGVDYDYDTSGGLARVLDVAGAGGRAYLQNTVVYLDSADAETFRVIDKLTTLPLSITPASTGYHFQNIFCYGAVNDSQVNLESYSNHDPNWSMNHTSGPTHTTTTKSRANTYRAFLYLKAGRWAVWFDADSVPELSGTVPRTQAHTSTTRIGHIITGDTIEAEAAEQTMGAHIFGRMTTA
jgi:hypothetical protein